jgi:hypothetical protein
VSDLYKFGVRLFFAQPNGRPLRDFIPVFHGWIQRKALPGHLLLDVHDYSHVVDGPGILLVAHEANINVDATGLVYTRKQPASLRETLAAAKQAAGLLGFEFKQSECEVFANDRLLAPNDNDAAARWLPVVKEATGGAVTRKANDPRDRLAFHVKA